MSGDCLSQLEVGTGIWKVGTRDAGKRQIVHKTALHNKEL